MGRGFVCARWLLAGIARQTDVMLMLGLHVSSPIWLRGLCSTAPASHSARVSTPMMAPSSRASDLFHALPKFTGFMKLVGQ